MLKMMIAKCHQDTPSKDWTDWSNFHTSFWMIGLLGFHHNKHGKINSKTTLIVWKEISNEETNVVGKFRTWTVRPLTVWPRTQTRSEGLTLNKSLIRESWKKKSKTRDHHRAYFAEKKIQSAALRRFVYVSELWNFFPENTLHYGPKKWHIFLFSTA